MPPDDRTPRVSVVVAARDSEATLPSLLASLERQTASRDQWELVVVDDDSSDTTAEIARSSAVARLVQPGAHVGVCAAQNIAIRETSGEIVAITDADCEVAADWIERGIEAIEAGADVVAGRYDVPLGDPPSVVALVDVTHYYDMERHVREGHAAAANLWARRAVFERVGGFDETLVTGGDTDWTERAVAAGCELRYAPDMVVRHPALRSPRRFARRMYLQGLGGAERGQSHLRSRIGRRGEAYMGHQGMREQLERLGVEPTPWLMFRMHFVKNVFSRLPLLAGNVVGTLRRRRG